MYSFFDSAFCSGVRWVCEISTTETRKDARSYRIFGALSSWAVEAAEAEPADDCFCGGSNTI